MDIRENKSEFSSSIRMWEKAAKDFLWEKEWEKVTDGNFLSPPATWFTKGKLNIVKNCLDRHLETRGNKLALIWEPNDPREKFIRLTYKELYFHVGQFAAILKNNGVEKGDRVCIYMPMIPETVIAMLACARIGAIHVVIFSDYSAHAIASRIRDSGAKLVITSDGLNHGAKQIPLKRIMDEALYEVDSIKKVIVIERLGWAVNMEEDRDVWFEDELQDVRSFPEPEIMDAEDPLFILYTSGASGKPAGIQHTCGGYMVQTGFAFREIFKITESDIFYCTADIAWITGHSMMVYGPLLNGTTVVMYEGPPSYPDNSRICEIIDKHNVTIFYTSPTNIRTIKASDLEDIGSYSLNSLRLLGIVGESIDEHTWHWFNIHMGKEKCRIIDTWIQTETGTILIFPVPAGKTKPGYSGKPFPSIVMVLLDQDGNEIKSDDREGLLFIKEPWPSMARNIWNDPEGYYSTYFSKKEGLYFTGDGAVYDEDGNLKITGRVDDVINIHGQRFSVLEIENAINRQSKVLDSAVFKFTHPVNGSGIYAFVVCKEPAYLTGNLEDEILEQVLIQIGKSAMPDIIQIVRELPKNASGKVARPILYKIVNGKYDIATDKSIMRNPDIIPDIMKGVKRLLSFD